VRGIVCRGLRLELVAGLGIALAMSALSVVAAQAQGAPTITTLTAGAQSGCTQALTVTVTANGQPVTGTVAIEDDLNGKEVQLAAVALSPQGTASPTVSLTDGVHSLTAVYAGSATYQGSTSSLVTTANVTSSCEFTVSVSPATLTLTAGQSGTVTASVASSPDFTSTLTAPVFVTLSCSGLPDQSACTFTPENVEILPNATAPLTSSMVITTQAASASLAPHQGSNSVTWAFLLPGALSLGGLAWGAATCLAEPAFAAGIGGPSCHAGHNGLQRPLRLLPPRPAHQSGHTGRHVHSDHNRTVQQRRDRHYESDHLGVNGPVIWVA